MLIPTVKLKQLPVIKKHTPLVPVTKAPSSKRFFAFGVHFAICFAIFLVLANLIYFVWYPYPLTSADGGWQGIRIIAFVDVVLGPALTLIIFNPKKTRRELTFDISCIAIAQLIALIIGVTIIYQQRPVVVSLEDGAFYTVTEAHFAEQSISLDQLKQFNGELPAKVFVQKPSDAAGLHRMHQQLFENQLPPHAQFELYQPLANHLAKLKNLSVDIKTILENQPKMKATLTEYLNKTNTQLEDYAYLPLKARYATELMVMIPATGETVLTLSYVASK